MANIKKQHQRILKGKDKSMKDRSIFQSYKELGEFRLEDSGCSWCVYEYLDNAYVFVGRIEKKNRESNKELYDRALDLVLY